MQIRVIVVSASLPRRLQYREELELRGCVVETAVDEASCLSKAEDFHPEVFILESSIPGAGIDGLLSARERDSNLRTVPIIVIDDRRDAAQTYRIGAYQLAGYWRSIPTADELMLAIRLTVSRADTLHLSENLIGTRSG